MVSCAAARSGPLCYTGVTFARQRPIRRGNACLRRRLAHAKPRSCLQKPVATWKKSAPLLAEVKALREDVEHEGAELRSSWGAVADKPKVPSRVLNLSPLHCAQNARRHRPASPACGAGALVAWPQRKATSRRRSIALIATLKRLSGEPNAPYPSPMRARAGAAELEAESDRLFGNRQNSGPRARIMATLPPEGG